MFERRTRDYEASKMTSIHEVRSRYRHNIGKLLMLALAVLVLQQVSYTHQQSSISLNNAQWFVSNSNNSIQLPAQVPGGIYSDLRRNNYLKNDLLYGKNDLSYRWVGHENWTYTTTFTIDHQIARSQSVRLVLHGVDTVSSILINGQEVGSTDNMFVRYKFDIKPHLKLAGLPNVLVIKFESPIKYSARKSRESIRQNRGKITPPYCPSPAQRGECHVNFIRKMQASFSWDWGPAFPSVGLYKDIEIEYGSFGMIRDILIETRRLPPLIQSPRPATPSPQVIISSSIRHQVRTPTASNNRTVPYIRAPPYYMGGGGGGGGGSSGMRFSEAMEPAVDITAATSEEAAQQLLEENWLLKTTLVAEMVQPSFGYNLRVEFNLNGVLHYESDHINVVANSDGFIRLGFNLRVDTSRMQIKPWWPNNAGSQTLYTLTARIMPIPNPPTGVPDHIRLNPAPQPAAPERVARALPAAASGPPAVASQPQPPPLPSGGGGGLDSRSGQPAIAQQQQQPPSSVGPSEHPAAAAAAAVAAAAAHAGGPQMLQVRKRPLQTPAVQLMTVLATQQDANSYQLQYVSEKEVRFGFRSVELIQEPVTRASLEDGLTFNFRVNGVDLFAMGSNWIPPAVLPEYTNDFEYVKYLLQSAKDANMNMLRVWGGGLYESDEFYKLADEMGIMIWHDFMFACALYPVDDDFLSSVRLEIEQQVQRLQYHPSIVLWAGNNENEMAIAGPWWPEVAVWNKKLRENYAKLYVDTIKPIVQILDPTRPYIESSPSNGILSQTQPNAIARTPNDNKYGDVHHYDYLADSFDWTNYPSTRFASEYGFQSYPSFNALTSVSAPADWKYPITGNLLHRQHRLTGETEIKIQIRLHFKDIEPGGAEQLKQFVYLSQLVQAIAIKTESEYYRRNRFIDPETKLGKTMGALYWQLNDVWQAPTWSSIEHGGKWKMLHYFARRFFFPVQLMPYIITQQQPSYGGGGQSFNGGGGLIQSIMSAGSALVSGYGPAGGNGSNRAHQSLDSQLQQQLLQQQINAQRESSSGQLFVIDLVRDDLFYLLDSFNVTIRFYRWTSFAPVWQDFVYVKHTRPQNVTRIYEQDLLRITRQPGVISLSSGVFQVIIEQQPRLGLSQIDNYFIPVAPTKVTAMRVPRITVELVQGPFELTDVRAAQQQQQLNGDGPATQWSCAYRITLVSDAIAMFVWLDLNLLNIAAAGQGKPPSDEPPNMADASHNRNLTAASSSSSSSPPRRQLAPENILLHNLPPSASADDAAAAAAAMPMMHSGANNDDRAPAHIHLHTGSGDKLPGEQQQQQLFHQQQQQQRQQQFQNSRRRDTSNYKRELDVESMQVSIKRHHHKQTPPQPHIRQYHESFRPLPGMGSNTLRYQFSDNAFNMFEQSKVIDLYLNRCLTKSQVEVAIEIQSMADVL